MLKEIVYSTKGLFIDVDSGQILSYEKHSDYIHSKFGGNKKDENTFRITKNLDALLKLGIYSYENLVEEVGTQLGYYYDIRLFAPRNIEELNYNPVILLIRDLFTNEILSLLLPVKKKNGEYYIDLDFVDNLLEIEATTDQDFVAYLKNMYEVNYVGESDGLIVSVIDLRRQRKVC